MPHSHAVRSHTPRLTLSRLRWLAINHVPKMQAFLTREKDTEKGRRRRTKRHEEGVSEGNKKRSNQFTWCPSSSVATSFRSNSVPVTKVELNAIIVPQLESGSDDVVAVSVTVLSSSSVPNTTPFHFNKFLVPEWLITMCGTQIGEQKNTKNGLIK